jgi:hypothetical protein
VDLQKISADWSCPVVVVATGPSLTAEVAARVRRARWPEETCRVVAVNDAFRLLPYADILYACDEKWWRIHIDAVRKTFHGERWTSHDPHGSNDKRNVPEDWGLKFVAGSHGGVFSTDPRRIAYGSNSGFQAINLALLKGATRVVLVGFDMGGRGHFFGDHPEGLHNRDDYRAFLPEFRDAARHCRVPIVNATPKSALDCFPRVDLEEELAHHRLLRNGSELDAGARASCA